MTEVDHLVLAGEFPGANRQQWLDAVRRVLFREGSPTPDEFESAFTRQLVTRTVDGLEIQPLYSGRDANGRPERPGCPPHTRGIRDQGGWDLRPRIGVGDDPAAAATRALAELEGGATSLLLDLRAAPRIDVDVLDSVTAGVYLDLAPVVLDAGTRTADAAAALFALWDRRGVAASTAVGVLGCDPIGGHARLGGLDDLARALAEAAELARCCAGRYPRVRAVVVDATPVHDAGGSDVDELGVLLASGLAYLRVLTDAGLTVDVAARQLEFRLAATADQFATIAKLRAGRRLWDRVAGRSGVGPEGRAARQHAMTSAAMMTRYDPWVNLLRTTTACFGAAVGGAAAITVVPHDAPVTADGSELGRRLARNVSTILAEETNLTRVVDPAGGSWYVEALTTQLAAAAWTWFTAIERAGGMVAALESGLVAERVSGTWTERLRRLARRSAPVTGVSEFPNIDEPPPPAPDAAAALVGEPAFAPLSPRRYSEPFEALRGRADRAAADETSARPTIFLAALGPASASTARVTFAKNWFEAGGIRAVAPPSGAVTAAEAAEAFTASGAPLACLCSSDTFYAELAADTATALKAAGARRVYLAGRPGEAQAELEAAGVDEFIMAGGDILASLARALHHLGIE